MEHIIAIDIGTTNLKSALLSKEGMIKKIKKNPTPLHKEKNSSWYEPEEIWTIVKAQICDLIKIISPKHQLRAIVITGMAEAGLVLEKESGKSLSKIIPWFEKCTISVAKKTNDKEEFRRFQYSGLRNSFKYGVYKYIWALETNGLKSEKTIWLSVCDYIFFKLTGKYITVPGFAVRTYLYDMYRGKYDEKSLHMYGLVQENFPEVWDAGKTAYLSKNCELIDELGEETQVCLAGHDHICALYGIAGEDERIIVNSLGTTETYVKVQRQKVLTEKEFKQGVVFGPYPIKNRIFSMGNLSSSGSAIDEVRRSFSEEITWETVCEILEERKLLDSNLYFFPFSNGIGTPLFRDDLRTGFSENRERFSKSELITAVAEGIGYQGKWVIECLTGQEVSESWKIYCSGGPVENNGWMILKSNILENTLLVLKEREATLLGAACIYLL